VTPALGAGLIVLGLYALLCLAIIAGAVWATWETVKQDNRMRFGPKRWPR
jgi:prepilin signal peptidase PulO-like enzyme (type II secretory pathway)